MREREWYLRLAELHALITPLYQQRGLPIPDFQDLQHQLCEYHKYASIRRGLKQRLKREYRPAPEPEVIKTKRRVQKPKPSTEPPSTAPIDGAMAVTEAITLSVQPSSTSKATQPPPWILKHHAAEQSRASTKPTAYQIDFASASLPPALTTLIPQSRWVNWRWEKRDGKWTKPPIQPSNGHYARNNDPSTWGTYADAVKRVTNGGADGIGFCLFGLELGAVDLDDCRDRMSGIVADWAQAIVQRAPEGAYCESRSPAKGCGSSVLGRNTVNITDFRPPTAKARSSFTATPLVT
jgi:hypothetical protein